VTTPPTEQQLDEYEAAIAAYQQHPDIGFACCSAHPAADAAAALVAEVRRLRPALDEMTHCRDNALAALYRDDVETDIDLEETIADPFHGPGWDWDESDLKLVVREAADAVRPAFGKLTEERDRLRNELAAVAAFLDEQERAARLFELPTPAWVEAVRAASVPPAAPLSASQPSSVSESAQSPTGAPTGRLGDSGAPGDFRSETEISARGWTA
jgi:hypothetical protein